MATAATNSLVFYHYWSCPYCQRARVALAEKGIAYESIAIEPGADKPQELLDLNPEGTVPTVQDGELGLYGSGVITEYLEDRYPEPALMPGSAHERARARLLLNICDGGLGSALYRFRQATSVEEADEQNASESAEKIAARLERLSEILGERAYFCADTFGMADIWLVSFVLQLRDLDFPSEQVPQNIQAWMGRVAERPSVRQEVLEYPGR